MSLDSLVEGDTWKGREWENEEVGKESSQLTATTLTSNNNVKS